MLRTIFKNEGGSSFLKSINIDPNKGENLTLEGFAKWDLIRKD